MKESGKKKTQNLEKLKKSLREKHQRVYYTEEIKSEKKKLKREAKKERTKKNLYHNVFDGKMEPLRFSCALVEIAESRSGAEEVCCDIEITTETLNRKFVGLPLFPMGYIDDPKKNQPSPQKNFVSIVHTSQEREPSRRFC
jgi:hypothetical protein